MIVSMDAQAENRPPEPEPADAGPETPAGLPTPPQRLSRRRKVLVWASVTTAFVLVIGVVCGWLLLRQLNHNIRTADAGTVPSDLNGTQDILLVGSDNRSGSDAKYGTADGARSDTTILFHTSAGRRDATAVSIPRDSMVQIPDCKKSDGTIAPATFGMFNSAFDEGGIACTVKTVEELTGINITHFVVLDFTGFAATVNALGGVTVCTTQAIVDQDSELNIPAGVTKLNGDQALAFVRVRHIGDGSDLERIVRQQYFLHEFSAQIRGSGLLTDPLRLYRVLNDATRSIVTDPDLGSLSSLYALTQTLNQIPNNNVTYATVPVTPYPDDPDRVVWQEPNATELWDSLLNPPKHAPGTPGTAGTAAGTGARGASGAGTGAVAGAVADTGSGPNVPTVPIAVLPTAGDPGSTRPDLTAGSTIPLSTGLATTWVASGTDPQGMYTCPVN
jgi:LCP family protein required for cell wall assembly